MVKPHQRWLAALVVAGFFSATTGVPTPRPSELVACPYNAFCLPTASCQSSNIVYDVKNVKASNVSFNGSQVESTSANQNSFQFACGVLEPSDGHVCCAVSSRGFEPSPQIWLPNMPPSVRPVTPWPGFRPTPAGEDGASSRKNSTSTEFQFNVILFPGEDMEETDSRSAQENPEGWPCGEALSPAALNETYRADERPINQGDYSWQVAVLTVDMHYLCGGGLVGNRAVVTLASCLYNMTMNQLLVRVGDQDLSSKSEPLPAYDVPVTGIALDPAYDQAAQRNDMAVLLLQHSVSSLPHVRAACLPVPKQSNLSPPLNPQFSTQQGSQPDLSSLPVALDLTHCHLASWGLEAEEQGTEGSFSYVLRGGAFYVLSRETCQVILGRNASLPEDERCVAGYGGTAICRGGGGSALVCRQEDRFVLDGIIARNPGCSSNTPLAYIKVSDHLNFILDQASLRPARREETVKLPTTQENQAFLFNNNNKPTQGQLVGRPGTAPSNKFSSFNIPSSSNSNNANKYQGFIQVGTNNGFVVPPDDGLPSGSDDGPYQIYGPDKISSNPTAYTPLPTTPTRTPVYGSSTGSTIVYGQGTVDNSLSGAVQSSLVPHGVGIVTVGSDRQVLSSGGSSYNLLETNGNLRNPVKFVGQTDSSRNNQKAFEKNNKFGSVSIGSDESGKLLDRGSSYTNINQQGSQYTQGGFYPPQAGIGQQDNAFSYSNGLLVGTNNDRQAKPFESVISTVDITTDPPKIIVDLSDPKFTNNNDKFSVLLNVNDLDSSDSEGLQSDTIVDRGDSTYTPSIIYNTVRDKPKLQAQEVSGVKFLGSFEMDSNEKSPHMQFDGRREFESWRPNGVQNRPLPPRGFKPHRPTGYNSGPHQLREPPVYPFIGYQQHAPGYQQSAPDYQHRPPGYQHRPPGYQHRPPGYQHRPSGYQHRPPGYQHRPPGYQRPPPVYQHGPHINFNFVPDRTLSEPIPLPPVPGFTPALFSSTPPDFEGDPNQLPPVRGTGPPPVTSTTSDEAPGPSQPEAAASATTSEKQQDENSKDNLGIVYQYLSKYQ